MAPGLILSAPASGSGKTLLTLGLLRALNRAGIATAPAKTGPDYIDPGFLAAAAGMPCVNLDPWGMRAETLAYCMALGQQRAPRLLVEGVMGLFDGAVDGTGSTADLAAATGWPVLLVIDGKGQSASLAAVVRGFMTHRDDIRIAGLLLNRVGSARHRGMIEAALTKLPDAPPVIGAVPEDPALAVPSRHLGLVQAQEQADLDARIDAAAALIDAHIDRDALLALFADGRPVAGRGNGDPYLPPPGQRIAVADDAAFAFCYPALLSAWREAGAEIMPFSPLAGEGPDPSADSVYLPGGYPELHAGAIAANDVMRDGLSALAASGAAIYGECGGYMTLGEGLIDAAGTRHRMMGLLPVSTSFAEPRRSLGLRKLTLAADTPLGGRGARFSGHEFHYAVIETQRQGAPPLFTVTDAAGAARDDAGHVNGTVAGSFIHLIDRAP